MKKYSIVETRQDYNKAYADIARLEEKLDKKKLNWRKIKRARLDELITIIGILNKKVKI